MLRGLARKQLGTRGVAVAARYDRFESFGRLFDLRAAILATASTRSAICLRVNPSGKTTWNGFGIAITVTTGPVAVERVTVLYTSVLESVVGAPLLLLLSPPPIAATASQPRPPSRRTRTPSARIRRRATWPGFGPCGGRPCRGGITPRRRLSM